MPRAQVFEALLIPVANGEFDLGQDRWWMRYCPSTCTIASGVSWLGVRTTPQAERVDAVQRQSAKVPWAFLLLDPSTRSQLRLVDRFRSSTPSWPAWIQRLDTTRNRRPSGSRTTSAGLVRRSDRTKAPPDSSESPHHENGHSREVLV